MSELGGTSALVVGGAGFVGGNLVRELLARDAARVLVVDNLLSAERENVPDDARVTFVEGSIADDAVLAQLEDEFDYVFHLATYHGNQSSIADPLADHEHNLITTLKLFERIKGFEPAPEGRLRGVRAARSRRTPTARRRRSSRTGRCRSTSTARTRSPRSWASSTPSTTTGRTELPTVRARFQNVYGPGEILGAGRWRGTPATVWRNVTPTFVYRALKGMPLELDNEGRASRDFIYVGDIVDGLLCCATRGEPGDVYNLASGVETSIRELAETINRMTGTTRPSSSCRRATGTGRGTASEAPRRLGASSASRHGCRWTTGWRRTIEWMREQPCPDRRLRPATRVSTCRYRVSFPHR